MEKLSLLYASTLFDIALEHEAVDVFLEQAVFLRDTLQDPECLRILVHPHIPASKKQEFFSGALTGRIHEDLLAFLFLAADKNRETFIVPSLNALIGIIERYMKIVTANVFSAAALSEEQVEVMKEMLSDKLDKKVKISVKVDPSVIGGPYIYVDGYYIDWTVKKRLRDLTVHMKEGCGA